MKNVKVSIYLIRSGKKYYFADIDITVATGEIFYRPSMKIVTRISGDGKKEISINEPIKLDHFSFHKDGKVHATKSKKTKKKYIPLNNESEFLKISETGQRTLLTDIIKSIKTLPIVIVKSDREILYTIPDNIDSIFLRLELISGRNILKNEIKKIPREDKEGKIIDATRHIAIGVESGNSDKALFLFLFQTKDIKIETERFIFIPSVATQKLSKITPKDKNSLI